MSAHQGSSSSQSSRAFIERANSSLPLKLTTEDIESSPQFVQLLSSLSRHLTPEGVSVTKDKDLKEAQDSLKHEKHLWLTAHILHLELQELVLDNELKSLEIAPSSSQAQYEKAVKQNLSLNEVADYIDCDVDPCRGAALLGLTKQEVLRNNPHRKNMKGIQQKLIPQLEERLRQKCDNLVTFHQTSTTQDTEEMTYAKASQLPTFIEADIRGLEAEKSMLKKDRSNREAQFWMYYKALMESMGVLEELLGTYRLQSQSEIDLINSEWLVARADALELKLKLLDVELQCETYYDATVKALTTIRRHLDVALHDGKKEKRHLEDQLQTYNAVGMGFDDIVSEYTKLKSDIENKTWALEAFNKYNK
ncbi:unnamed protein product [Owenia fusiformis]|uniref:Uncharacterized protein n=1 Tax=Owenia fusiformis TaxID=6347 RepID=A0A8J1TW24_OWEFU|nr:unnamed protein product [Owenia fusiformis]